MALPKPVINGFRDRSNFIPEGGLNPAIFFCLYTVSSLAGWLHTPGA